MGVQCNITNAYHPQSNGLDEIFNQFCCLMGVQCNITNAYHPQSNGLDEIFNQTLQCQLLKFVGNVQDQWDLYLDAILFFYRISRQDSTKYSPFYLVYATLPVDLNQSKDDSHDSDETSIADSDGSSVESVSFEKHLETMIGICKSALLNIERAQERQKKYYDAKHCKDKVKYQVGRLVLLKNCKKLSRKGSKLEQNWTGPYKIHEVLGKGTFRLSNSKDSTKVLKTVYNMTRLKLYCQPDEACVQPPISQPSLLKVQPLSSSQLSTSPPSPTKVHSPISQALLSNTQPSISHTLLSTTVPISQPSLLKVQPLSSSQLSTSQPSPPKVHSPTRQALSSTRPSQPSPPKVQCLSSSQSSTGQHSPSKVLSPTNLTVLSNAQSTNKQSPPCTLPSFTNLPTSTISSSCSCKTRCATKKCPCKANHIPCSAYCHPPKSCVYNLSSTEGKKEIIDLSHVQSEKHLPVPWINVAQITLYTSDRDVIATGEWLNDKHLHAAQYLLQQQYPNISGLQDPILQVTNSFYVQGHHEFV